MDNAPCAVFVCHVGPGLGLGHLARCLVAADALNRRLGASVLLLIQGAPIQRADLAAYAHRFLSMEENLLDAVTAAVREQQADLVVFDLHPRLIPADADRRLAEMRALGCKVVSVDALVSRQGQLDLFFVPSLRLPPAETLPDNVPIMFGWDCFLLKTAGAPAAWKPGKRVLALTGGSDTTNLGQTLPTLLNASLPGGTELHWVTGPFAQRPVWPTSPRIALLEHQAPSGLEALMRGAQYAITVFGVSFFELLALGVPTVVFSPYGGKDDADLAAIAEAGVALVARHEADAVAKLSGLMEDQVTAAALFARARQKMSVPGGHTFEQAISALLESS